MGVRERVLIAVDGGGTKTDVAVLTPSGKVLAHVRGPDSNHQTIGLTEAIRRIDTMVRDALHAAETTLGAPVEPIAAGLYLCGLDLPVEITELTAAAEHLDWFAKTPTRLVDNDTFALLRAGTSEPDAVAVVCGTGINCVARRADGLTARFPALGTISGDWGGGYHLGSEALWHAARAVDGRGPATLLADRVCATLGVPDIPAVIEGLHRGNLTHDKLATLAPVVFAAADDGDDIARSLVDRQAHEIVSLATTALRRLGLDNSEVPVVLGGGILAARHERLIDQIRQELATAAPAARLTFVTAPPVHGAALLVLEATGAPSPSIERAKRELA